MSRRRISFSLKFLFAVSTVLILLLGYSQWRRQTLLHKFDLLRSRGIILNIPAAWLDRLWQRIPPSAIVGRATITMNEERGTFEFGPDEQSQALLDELGIADINAIPPAIVIKSYEPRRPYDQSLIAE